MLNEKLAGRYLDPGLVSAGKASLADPRLLDAVHLPEYTPVPGSPVIDKGLDLKALFDLDPGKRDVLGTPAPSGNAFDIGAVEYKGD